jgi:lambda family phage portal protein
MDWFRRKPAPAPRASRRGFDGAMYNRLVADWITSSTSMDAELRSSLKRLRDRSRDLVRNNDYARSAQRAITNNVVGQGVRMQAAVKMRRGGRMDDNTNAAIESSWEKWCRKQYCHTAGVLSFHDIERQLMDAMLSDGEIFVRTVRRQFGNGKVPLALEIIEADRLDIDLNEMAKSGNEIRMGVERDQWGRPVAYHFKVDHPGDYPFGAGAVNNKTERVSASEVIHLFRQERPGQTRGISWVASAIMKMHHLQGYTEAEVIAARAEACRMGFITSPEDDVMQDGTDAGQAVSNFEPGRIERLMPGESFIESKPNRPGGQYEPFVRAMLHSMAAGLGVSYATLSRDYSQSNYSSGRLALLDDRDNWRVLQQWLIENFHRQVFDEWLGLAVLSGEVQLQGYETNPDFYHSVRWIPRGWQWVDPAKEMAAYKDAVRCGFTTVTDVVAQQGGDIEDVMQQRQRELQMAEEMGLVFDTDPHEIDGKGAQQGADVAEDAAEAPTAEEDRKIMSDLVAEQVRTLKDELRDIRIVASTRQEAQPINLNMALDTSSIDRAAQSLQDMTREALTQIREDVQNMPIVIPAPEVKIENIMPEYRAEVPTVNVVNQVQPAQVTVVDSHPSRAEQTVVRDKNDEIIKTVTNYFKE